MGDPFAVVVAAGTFRSADSRAVQFPRRWTPTWASTGITYTVEVSSPASPDEIARLLGVVDKVAEIPARDPGRCAVQAERLRAGATVAMPGTDDLDALVGAKTRAGAVPGKSVAVVVGDQLRWLRGFGAANLTSGSPARPETAYLWFSMTKIVTATAAMRLAEQGALDLDAPVNEYFEPFAVVRQPTAVTVRHLLSHSSGLGNPLPIRWVHPADTPPPDRSSFVEHLLARHTRLRSNPGERASYSNLGYLVLGEVIAQAAGRSYEDSIRGLVLEPLGMRHTGFAYEDCNGRNRLRGTNGSRRP